MTLLGIKNPVWIGSVGAAVVATFASMYESFQALTSVQVSHFVEWFSGSVLDSIWSQNQVVSTGSTFLMNDSINGGLQMTSTSIGLGSLSFNDIRHYDPAGLVFLCVVDFSATAYDTGYGVSQDERGVGTAQQACFHNRSAGAFILGQSADGTATETATDIAPDLNPHIHKMELTSSNILYTMDGVLKLTKTTNRPTVPQQPNFVMSSADGNGEMNILYCEIYNTSISILSSLYERLSALTQVMNQRVVETFSGALLNERWNVTNLVSAGVTAVMDDSVDGGVSLVTNSSSEGSINFNNIRQYASDASIIIFVEKQDATAYDGGFGFSNSTQGVGGAQQATFHLNVTNTFMKAQSADAGATEIDTSINNDLLEHSFKIELGSADIKYTIDGVLDITKTTNRPTTSQQPIATMSSSNGAGKMHIRYLEAYNKLTTEADFPSVYELFNPLTTIARQHFWEWFDGNDISSRWTKTDISGTGTFVMIDAIDEGFSVTADAGAPNRSSLNFNNKRHYDETACIMIATARRVSVAAGFFYIGLFNATGSPNPDSAYLIENTTNTFKQLGTYNGASPSQTNTDIAIDTNFHVYKIECGSADIQLTIDGVLKVTKTTDRPAARLQPLMFTQSDNATPTESRVRYIEAFNT